MWYRVPYPGPSTMLVFERTNPILYKIASECIGRDTLSMGVSYTVISSKCQTVSCMIPIPDFHTRLAREAASPVPKRRPTVASWVSCDLLPPRLTGESSHLHATHR